MTFLLQVEYEVNKESPPAQRNASPVVNHILWARQLQQRVKESVASCQSMRTDMHGTALFRKFMRIATVTDETLADYMARWYQVMLDSSLPVDVFL